jgi:GntR family transcriptional regulator
VSRSDPVYLLERKRIVNGYALANQSNYIPYEICPGLEDDDLSRHSFQKLLEEKYHTFVAEAEETARLAVASDRDAEALGLSPGDQVLIVERLSLTITRMPVVWADIHVRTDRFEIVASLWPEAASLLKSPSDLCDGIAPPRDGN